MKKSLFQKIICLILSVTTLLGAFGITASAATDDGKKYGSNKDTAATLIEMQELAGVKTYEEYKKYYGEPDDINATGTRDVITINIKDIIEEDDEGNKSNGVITSESDSCAGALEEGNPLWPEFGGKETADNSIYLPASGSTTWRFEVPDGAEGYYYIKIESYSCYTDESSISTIERRLLIDGQIPFNESRNIKLGKRWEYTNVSVVTEDTDEQGYSVTTKYKSDKSASYKIVTEIKDGKKTVTTYTTKRDIIGNSMSPEIQQNPAWNTYYCQDSTGYYDGNFCYYILNGKRTITLEAVREPIIIKSIELIPYDPSTDALPTLAAVKADYATKGYTSAVVSSGDKAGNRAPSTVIQAEFPDAVSDSSVMPSNDNTSSATTPVASGSQLFNVIGETGFDTIGQWAEYKFSVNETGLYKMSSRYLQKSLEGMYVCRTLKLVGGHGLGLTDGVYGLADGTPTVPFQEAYDAQFDYNKDWQSTYISDSKGEVFEFYFVAGVEYTLRIECSLGSLKKDIQRAENVLSQINDCYLKILQLTGSAPDEYRDYKFMDIMPDVVKNLLQQAIELDGNPTVDKDGNTVYSIKASIEKQCGGKKGSHTATLGTIARLLDTMGSNDGYDIAANMSNLKSYLGTLGTWINDSKKGKLMIDSITVCPSDSGKKQLSKANANFFESFWFEITSFIYSFTTDYSAMGLQKRPSKSTTSIAVWIATGRDQSNIWRSLIDAGTGFTSSTGDAVQLKLVTAGTLLPSILSGKGPDVYIGLGASDVVNYAIRDAVIGVSGNSKNKSVQKFNYIFTTPEYVYNNGGNYTKSATPVEGATASFESRTFVDHIGYDPTDLTAVVPEENRNFAQAAMDTVTLLDVTYGVPQTMAFSMMFYRMDVLADLGVEVPDTWDQLLSVLPVLQSNNMAIGVNYTLAIDFMLYQMGGNMWKYTDDPAYAGARIGLDTTEATKSFEYVCRLFSDYSFPVSYDAANRFRTGEMPILIGSYEDLYNKLVVYATEIEGLWEFCPVPGTERVNEKGETYINYDSLATVTATVMLNGVQNKGENVMRAAWNFVQWQTSANIQAQYGNRMVALIGPSAKYETANIKAIKDLSWTAEEREAIEDQIEHMSSIVNYPGSYIIARYMKFAFLDVVNSGADAADALNSYIGAINTEITRKREEFKDFDLEVLKNAAAVEKYEAEREAQGKSKY